MRCWLILTVTVTGTTMIYRGRRAAGQLVRRLLAVGLSKYEPDIEAALAKAEGKARLKVKKDRPVSSPVKPTDDEDLRH
jgi:hypothetical protein